MTLWPTPEGTTAKGRPSARPRSITCSAAPHACSASSSGRTGGGASASRHRPAAPSGGLRGYTRALFHYFVPVFCFCVWILHINEN